MVTHLIHVRTLRIETDKLLFHSKSEEYVEVLHCEHKNVRVQKNSSGVNKETEQRRIHTLVFAHTS